MILKSSGESEISPEKGQTKPKRALNNNASRKKIH